VAAPAVGRIAYASKHVVGVSMEEVNMGRVKTLEKLGES
jgi:hypothetical protein